MKTVRILYHLARADFYERTRRYSFLLMLGLVLWVGYVMASGQFCMTLGTKYAGIIDSAWVGATMALTTSFVVGLVGFYIVKGSVARDYATGVGQIMATTPMSRQLYMLGKWLSNYAVLGITVVIVALAGIGMDLWFGTGGLDIVALVRPLVLIGLPWLGLVAALAVLFESITWLRGSLGNIVYLILWFVLFGITYSPLAGWTPAFRVNPTWTPSACRSLAIACRALAGRVSRRTGILVWVPGNRPIRVQALSVQRHPVDRRHSRFAPAAPGPGGRACAASRRPV